MLEKGDKKISLRPPTTYQQSCTLQPSKSLGGPLATNRTTTLQYIFWAVLNRTLSQVWFRSVLVFPEFFVVNTTKNGSSNFEGRSDRLPGALGGG